MIQKMIDDKLKQEQEEHGKRLRSGKWSPSALGRCYRYQVWNRQNEKPTDEPEPRILRVFAAGKLFHNFVQQYLPPHQVEVKCEKKDIFGYADIVTEDTVYDIKSVHGRQFFHTGKKGFDVNTEKYSNILQVMTYAWMLNKPKGVLVFISKDDMCIDEFGFYLDKWLPEIEKELKILREYWDSQLLPPCRPRAYGGKEGKYCPYKTKCGDECKVQLETI